MNAKIQGIEELNRKLREYQGKLKKPKQKTAILAAGGAKVKQAAAKAPTPKSTKVHFYYSKGRKIEIKPGNLRKSMKVYRGKEGDVYVGPKFLRRVTAPEMGGTAKTASGYYAAALYGSASAFRKEIMEPALSKAAAAAIQAIDKAFAKWHKKNNP